MTGEREPTREPPPAREPADEAETGRDAEAAGSVCDLCGGAMYERHCRIVCPHCGYQRDCSDP